LVIALTGVTADNREALAGNGVDRGEITTIDGDEASATFRRIIMAAISKAVASKPAAAAIVAITLVDSPDRRLRAGTTGQSRGPSSGMPPLFEGGTGGSGG